VLVRLVRLLAAPRVTPCCGHASDGDGNWHLSLRAHCAGSAAALKNRDAKAESALPWQCYLMKKSFVKAFNRSHNRVPEELSALVDALVTEDLITDACLESLAVRAGTVVTPQVQPAL
jgi:hypothetical protein